MLILSKCCLDNNDIICLGKALQHNSKIDLLGIVRNYISPHAFSELLISIQHSAITTFDYDGHITMTQQRKMMCNSEYEVRVRRAENVHDLLQIKRIS